MRPPRTQKVLFCPSVPIAPFSVRLFAEWSLLILQWSLLCAICFAMSDDDAARFRQQAEDCRQQAAKVVSPLDKEAWLRVAEEWLKLAMSVEKRRE
jgi:hypothetical protein